MTDLPKNTGNNFPPDRWCNDEIAVHVECKQTLPSEPLPEKVMQQLRAERARTARLDPAFRAELERAGIFLTPDELAYFADAYARKGFGGGLNWYRSIVRNWELQGELFPGGKIPRQLIPALMVVARQDRICDVSGS